MVLKVVFTAIPCIVLAAWSGLAVADGYRADQLLGLDLSKAVLSPRPLGPPSQFVPGPLDVNVDRGSKDAQASMAPEAEPKVVTNQTRVAHVSVQRSLAEQKPRGPARTRLARHHGNPLDAQAFDTRIQAWPCKSGGICNWKR
jgi:hypothetical protein